MAKLVELNLNPDRATLKSFGWIALVGFGLLALMAYYETFIFAFGLGDARETVALVLAGAAAPIGRLRTTRSSGSTNALSMCSKTSAWGMRSRLFVSLRSPRAAG